MAKKTINIDMLLQKWMQVYPTIYYAVLNEYDNRIDEEADFIYQGQPKDISPLVDNVKLIVSDKRWHWPSDRTPFEILDTVPHDRRWSAIADCGPAWKNKRRVNEILREEKHFKGRIDKLTLPPNLIGNIGGGMYVDVQPHLVLAFESDEDLVYWKLKYS